MYGHIRTASCLLACVARVPSHVASRHGWEHVCLSAEASCAPADEAPEDVFQLSNGREMVPLGSLRSFWSHRTGFWSPCLPSQNCYHHYHQQQLASFASKAGGGSKHRGAGRDKGAAAVGEEAPLEFDLAPFVSQMRSALEHYQKELAGIRTGRASPGLLEGVMVGESSHGKHVPVRALGTVVVRNPHLLVVEVYNPQDAQPLAEAIQSSPLKLQARVEGLEVLVEVPRLTMDMVERMVRLAGQEAEAARAEVRRARHKALDLAKRVAAGGGVSKEETKRREVQVQVATDKHIAEVDALLRAKETELREKH